MENTNKNGSKLEKAFKDDNPKLLMILNGITAAIWVFVTAMNIYLLNKYAHISFNPFFIGSLALVYILNHVDFIKDYVKI